MFIISNLTHTSSKVIRCFVITTCISFYSTCFANTPLKETKNLIGHGGPVNSVAISNDGQYALTGSLDYAVMLWDLQSKSNEPLLRFTDHQGAVTSVSFLPSGKQALSTGDEGNLYLWNLETKEKEHTFEGHKAKVVSISVSENGKYAATSSWDGSARIWDLVDKKSLQTIQVDKNPVNAVLISNDNQTLYTAGYDGKIRSWDFKTGEFIKTIYIHSWPINIMRWLPDGKQLVFGTTNGDVLILDSQAKDISKILIPHEKPVLGLAVSKQHNLIASGGNDGVIRVWDLKDWSLKGEISTILGPVWALAFMQDGKSLYYGSLDDDAKYWKIEKNQDDTLWVGHKPRRFQVKTGLSLGEIQFARKCSVCHTLTADDANRAGPTLHKIFGRKAGSISGYNYSDSLKTSPIIWNEYSIDQLFVKGPQEVVPGTKMPLQKVKDDEKRKALIDYLKKATH